MKQQWNRLAAVVTVFVTGLILCQAAGASLLYWIGGDGNWSQVYDVSGSDRGWSSTIDGVDNTLTSYPTASSQHWLRRGPEDTWTAVRITIDVANAGMQEIYNSAGGQGGRYIIDSSDPDTNKLTFHNTTSGGGVVWCTGASERMLEIHAPLVIPAGGRTMNLGGGQRQSRGPLGDRSGSVVLNGPIEGAGDIAYWKPGGAYFGNVMLGAANPFTGTILWGRGEGTGSLVLDHNLALQNATLILGIATEEPYPALIFDGRNDDPNAPFVIGALSDHTHPDTSVVTNRPLNLTGKTVQIGNNNQSTGYSGELSDGSFEKIGSGTLTLSGVSTYTGTTTVTAGTLKLDGSGSIAASERIEVGGGGLLDVSTATGGFEVAAGQTLAGTGWVTGAVRVGNGATVAPGSSIGTLNFADALTLGDGAVIEWEFQDTTLYDRIVADALVLENGAEITIRIRNPGAIDIQEDDRFTLYDGDVFGFAGVTFKYENESDWAGGFEIEEGSLVLVAIPEPGLGSLLLIGAALLALRRRCQA